MRNEFFFYVGIFRSARVRKAPSVSPEDAGAFCLGVSAWGILNCGTIKKGDTVVHNLSAGPLASAVAAVAKELGGTTRTFNVMLHIQYANYVLHIHYLFSYMIVTLSDKADTKSAAMAITCSHGSKLAKCLGPEGVMVALAEKETSSAIGASQSVSVTDMIFNGISVQGFDLGAYLATTDDASLSAAFTAINEMIIGKRLDVKAKVYPVADFANALKAASTGTELPVLKL